MTYIDKDKALNLDFIINVNLFESRRKTAERAVQAYAIAINAIPAADVRPVVRGKWQFHMFTANSWGYECRVCHTTWDTPTNFCPNCGAEMRGES